MSLKVYNAAPYSDAATVVAFHARLMDAGVTSIDTWTQMGLDGIDLSQAEPAILRQVASGAEALVLEAHVLALMNTTPSVDSVALASFAFAAGLPVLWVGASNLAAYRPGVVIVPDLDAALTWLVQMAQTLAPILVSGGAFEIRQALRARIP